MALLDKLGSFGAIVAAAACPVCFPKLALIGALLGLGGLGAYEAQLFIAAQGLVALAILGHAISYRADRRNWSLVGAVLGGAGFFTGLYLFPSEWLSYAGLAVLVLISLADLLQRLRAREPTAATLQSVIGCPQCGHRHAERMPIDACLFFYECKGCRAMLRPQPGDCCVFCSYGSVKCPPMQLNCCTT